MNYTINRNGKQLGPFSLAEVLQHLNRGLLLHADLGWSVGDQRWVPLADLLGPPRPTSDPAALFVGKKYATYYKSVWAKLDTRRAKISWNWAALLGVYWLGYRKMYSYASLMLGLFCVSVLCDMAGLDQVTELLGYASMGLWVSVILYGNHLYQLHVGKQVRAILSKESSENAIPQLVRRGGTSSGVAIGYLVAFGLIGWMSTASEPRAFLSALMNQSQPSFNGAAKKGAPTDSTQEAIPTAVQSLLELWEKQNAKCRGGSGDEPETLRMCDARDETSRRLDKLDYCYGKNGQIGAEMEWHRCGPDSIR
jgi:hypothetical protein